MKNRSFFYNLIIIFALFFFCIPQSSTAYSVLTHEAMIDACWQSAIRPLLLTKYPAATEDQLKEAHAYAYGGAVMPDMGYYPFGSKLFTNLTHYVRTGDFVDALFDEAHDLNEFAFACGALCHYNGDKYGHPLGTNKCVPMVYTKSQTRFGKVVTYEQDPVAHIRMEFGFDVLQTARGNYATEQYHDFIGFKVARPALERAFLKTYGLDINDVFADLSLAIETFRWIVKDLFPTITRMAWATRKAEIRKANPTATKRNFEYKMRKASYYHEFGKHHERPGFFPGLLSVVVRVIPKVGPLKGFKIKVPGAEVENIFIRSFDTVQVRYVAALKGVREGKHNFPNIDFDTGKETEQGEYYLADENYIDWLLKLKDSKFKHVDEDLKQSVIRYYDGCNEKVAAMAGVMKWDEINKALYDLKVYHTTNVK